jgi:hypothetical protein
VETVFLRKSADWCSAGLSRNYSGLGGFQQFRRERQKPFPANSIGFLKKEKSRVFCEAAAPRNTAHQKGPKGSPVSFSLQITLRLFVVLQYVYTPRESLSNKKIIPCEFSFIALTAFGFLVPPRLTHTQP